MFTLFITPAIYSYVAKNRAIQPVRAKPVLGPEAEPEPLRHAAE
jgi:hypothetical protein